MRGKRGGVKNESVFFTWCFAKGGIEM